MILSINQPAYLPWSGYFDRIARSDLHVVLDHVQFEKNSYVNRNRILGKDGPFWLTVPVRTKGKFGDLPINELEIDQSSNWQRKHLQSIRSAYGRSACFDECWINLEKVLQSEFLKLNDLCRATTDVLLDLLGIEVEHQFTSSHQFGSSKSELVLEICRNFKATTYLSGPFGREYLDLESFVSAGIKVEFHDYTTPAYPQNSLEFVSNLSILDLLFNEGKSAKRRFEKSESKKPDNADHEISDRIT